MKKKILTLIAILSVAGMLCGCNESKDEMTESAQAVKEYVDNEEYIESDQEERIAEEIDQASAEIVSEEEETVATEQTEAQPEQTKDPTQTESNAAGDIGITELDKTMYAIQVVNVREGDSTDFNIIGSLKQNEEAHVIGKTETGWYKIEYGGVSAYVAGNYLSDSKVEAVPQEEAVPVNTTNTNEKYVAVQIWDYDPKKGPYLKEELDMPIEECIQWDVNTTGTPRETVERNVTINIEARKEYPNVPRYTLHTEVLVNHNGGKEMYNRWE